YAGRVGDDDIALRRGLDVDVVEADRDVGDDPQFRQRLDNVGRELVGELAAGAVFAVEALEQLARRVAFLRIVVLDLGVLPKVLQSFGENALGDQNGRLHE